MGFPGGTSGKEPACQCRRHKEMWDLFLGWEAPPRRAWQPTSVFCLENPRDGEAWWAALYGIAQSRTRLKQLSSSSSSSSYWFEIK